MALLLVGCTTPAKAPVPPSQSSPSFIAAAAEVIGVAREVVCSQDKYDVHRVAMRRSLAAIQPSIQVLRQAGVAVYCHDTPAEHPMSRSWPAKKGAGEFVPSGADTIGPLAPVQKGRVGWRKIDPPS